MDAGRGGTILSAVPLASAFAGALQENFPLQGRFITCRGVIHIERDWQPFISLRVADILLFADASLGIASRSLLDDDPGALFGERFGVGGGRLAGACLGVLAHFIL